MAIASVLVAVLWFAGIGVAILIAGVILISFHPNKH
jgi:hypothetical protein